jgi:hypothetical protein
MKTVKTLFECWVEKGDCKAFKEAQVSRLRFFCYTLELLEQRSDKAPRLYTLHSTLYTKKEIIN